jgi:hypothetical protein
VHVPPRARARVHGADGIPKLLIGPARIELTEGERAVVVLGPVQIRAQVVPYEMAAPRYRITAGVTAWALVLGAVYAAAVAMTASAAPDTHEQHGVPGALQRVYDKFFGP